MNSLVKYLAIGGLALASFILPNKLNAQDRPINQPTPLTTIGDFFRSDNIRYATGYNKLDWYGSGDVNNDEKIDNDDLNQIQGSMSYRADVDGDGTAGTPNDKKTLEDYLKGIADHLPGHWDELKTGDERVSWLEKMIPIEMEIREGQDYSPSLTSTQSFINFVGISDISNYIQNLKNTTGLRVDSTANGLFNVPVRYLGLYNEGGSFDATNLQILDKDNPLDVTNYYAFNPKNGENISLEERLNYGYVSVGSRFKYGSGEDDFIFNGNIVRFKIENDQQEEINYMYAYVLRNSPRNSNINLTAPAEITIDKTAYDSNPDLLSDFYGVANVTSTPPEGQDFYWMDPNLNPNMTNIIKGEIKNEVENSIVDTTYLTPDKKIFTVKKKFLGLESEIDSIGRSDLGFYFEGHKHLLDKDSVYQNITVDLTTDVPRGNNLEKKFEISQNYPNPFNPTTTIKYNLPSLEDVSVEVYNSLGQKVRTLYSGEQLPGEYELKWHGKNDDGENVSSGVYLARVQAGKYVDTKKMVLTK